jgi:hypothetical protein
MNKAILTFRSLLVALLIATATPRLALAQEDYFSELTTAERLAPVVPPLPEEDAKYNIAVGALRFNAQAGVGFEFNDNIRLDPNESKVSDFIFRPSLEIDARWPLTEMNTLRFSIGLSYAKYFRYSEFDSRGVLFAPNSILAFTFMVGQVQITLRDRFSYQEDPYDSPVFSNIATYRRFENTAGVQADWNVNQQVKVTAGYEHYNLWTRDSTFDSLDRAIDTIFLRPAYAITPSVTVGVNSSVSWVDYDKSGPDNPKDARNYLVGGFVDFGLTEYTRFNVEAGWQKFDFSDNSSHIAAGGIVDSSDADTYYVKAAIKNRLTDAFSQRLSFTKTAEVGYQSNFYDLYRVAYDADWSAMKDLTVSPSLFYEHYETSGSIQEKADRFGAGLGLRYVLTPSVTLGVDYRFVLKESNFPDSDYEQNLVFVSLYYKF